MTTESRSSDPYGYRADLRAALANAAIGAFRDESQEILDEHRTAAFRVAMSLGYCRITGTQPSDLDGTLSESLAIAACKQLIENLRIWKRSLLRLREDFACSDEVEAELMVGDVLRCRFHVWAAFVAIDEAYFYEGSNDVSISFQKAYDAVLAGMEEYDRLLQNDETVDMLSTITETELLHNWRAMLATPYLELLPWWLDGMLEQRAECINKAAEEPFLTQTITASNQGTRTSRSSAKTSSKRTLPWQPIAALALAASLLLALIGYFGQSGTAEVAAVISFDKPAARSIDDSEATFLSITSSRDAVVTLIVTFEDDGRDILPRFGDRALAAESDEPMRVLLDSPERRATSVVYFLTKSNATASILRDEQDKWESLGLETLHESARECLLSQGGSVYASQVLLVPPASP